MLDVTGQDLQRAVRDAVCDVLGRAGGVAGLPTLAWTADFGAAGVTAVTGHVSPGDPDREGTARRWAEQLALQPVDDVVMDGTVEWRGMLVDGLPVEVWAVVDDERFEAAAAAMDARIRDRRAGRSS